MQHSEPATSSVDANADHSFADIGLSERVLASHASLIHDELAHALLGPLSAILTALIFGHVVNFYFVVNNLLSASIFASHAALIEGYLANINPRGPPSEILIGLIFGPMNPVLDSLLEPSAIVIQNAEPAVDVLDVSSLERTAAIDDISNTPANNAIEDALADCLAGPLAPTLLIPNIESDEDVVVPSLKAATALVIQNDKSAADASLCNQPSVARKSKKNPLKKWFAAVANCIRSFFRKPIQEPEFLKAKCYDIETQINVCHKVMAVFESKPELLRTEGIFRESATKSRIDQALDFLVKTPDISDANFLTKYKDESAHFFACLMKQVLRMSKEALLALSIADVKLYESFQTDETKEEFLVSRWKRNAPEKCSLLRELLPFLKKVSLLENVNLMSVSNLSTVLFISLILNGDDAINCPENAQHVKNASILRDLINRHDKLPVMVSSTETTNAEPAVNVLDVSSLESPPSPSLAFNAESAADVNAPPLGFNSDSVGTLVDFPNEAEQSSLDTDVAKNGIFKLF